MTTITTTSTDHRSTWVLAAGVLSLIAATFTPFAAVLALITIIAAAWMLAKSIGRAGFLWTAIALSAVAIVVLTVAGLVVGATTA
ncbi:hypothetical protein ACFUMH_01720 [Cellulomonas sp. NPDC057328]|uniref:hypothetical protein n=1 Tax=Cellulomonas sp. NPDC057328 TaxID=3346101 RepID=UPI00363E64A4